jgi:hypothetical protein
MLCDVSLVLDQLVPNGLLDVGGASTKSRHAVDDVGDEVKAIEVVQDNHVEGGGRRPFFLVTAHVQVRMIGAAMS